MRELIERFLSLHAQRTRYWHEKRARLLSDDLKALNGKPVALIKREEITAVIDKVQGRSHAAARLLFADIRPIFKWAVGRGIEVNPMADMKGPQPLKARDRVLNDDELCAFWQAASEQGWPFENIFKLLLLTAQRRDEVAAMRWREVDLDAGTWTFVPDPIEDDDENWRIRRTVKNGKAHTVDLHSEAVRLLDRLDMKSEDFVFSTTGRTPVCGFSKAKTRLDERMRKILGDKFQAWRTHDLRRTAASGMAALGFQPHVIERVLNHVSGAQGGLVGVYQRHEYRDERKQAILAWGDYVSRLVSEKALSTRARNMKRYDREKRHQRRARNIAWREKAERCLRFKMAKREDANASKAGSLHRAGTLLQAAKEDYRSKCGPTSLTDHEGGQGAVDPISEMEGWRA